MLTSHLNSCWSCTVTGASIVGSSSGGHGDDYNSDESGSSWGRDAGRGDGGGGTGRGGVAGRRSIYGYVDVQPTLNGVGRCPYCFCAPCVTVLHPTFLTGRAAADLRNAHKCYPLYRKFWCVLNELGLWRHDQ